MELKKEHLKLKIAKNFLKNKFINKIFKDKIRTDRLQPIW